MVFELLNKIFYFTRLDTRPSSIVHQHPIVVLGKRGSALWQAQTPQMYRFTVLSKALKNVVQNNLMITDERQQRQANHNTTTYYVY
jgi:2-C-methyl-D-erythritol 4-phosphate cytidylyltransferase